MGNTKRIEETATTALYYFSIKLFQSGDRDGKMNRGERNGK